MPNATHSSPNMSPSNRPAPPPGLLLWELAHRATPFAEYDGMKVAVDVASRPEAAGKTIVVILASHGIRYTAHPLWGAMKAEAAAALPAPPNMDKDAPLLLWKSEDAEGR